MTDPAAFERARQLFIAGNEAFEAGRLDEAEASYLASLRALPGRPSTLVNLAATQIAQGRPLQALESLEAALKRTPRDAQAWSHQGVALAALGRHDEAQASHAQALDIDTTRVVDWFHRAMALARLGQPGEALPCLDRAIALQPRDALLHGRRGQTLIALERHREAAEALELALQIDPTWSEIWSDLGSLRSEMGKVREALEAWEQALAHGGDENLLRFQMAGARAQWATGGEGEVDPPAHPPRTYVERLFDDYAATFDDHLKRLDYQAPQVLAKGLGLLTGRSRSQGSTPGPFRDALDLGCGTGLCAVALEPWTLRLTGVDLSKRMLEQARTLGRYDHLVQADLIEHLQQTESRHDLVVAADVFIYVGELRPVFAGVRRVLERGGVFCFCVELIDDELDYALRPSLRYGHSNRYLRELALQHGLEATRLEPGPLRRDERHALRGLYGWFTRID